MANHGYNVYVMGCSGARKHSCALTLVRVDGSFFDPIFDPETTPRPEPRQIHDHELVRRKTRAQVQRRRRQKDVGSIRK